VNRRIVSIGVAVALVGLALWYLPIAPGSDGARELRQIDWIVGLDAPLDVLDSPIAFAIAWSATFSTTVSLYYCGTHANCSYVTRSDYVTGATGDGGTLHWHGKAGQYFEFTSENLPVKVDFEYVEPVLGGTVGAATLCFGGVLTVLGWLAAPPVTSAPYVPPPERDRSFAPAP
jgi:hypothetical protein